MNDITNIEYKKDLINFLKNIKLYKSVINPTNKENNNYLSFNNKLSYIKLQVIIDILNNNIITVPTIKFYNGIYLKNKVELDILIYIICSIMYVNNDIIIDNDNILLNSKKIDNKYTIKKYLSTININIENIEYDSSINIIFDIKNIFILDYFFTNKLNLIIELYSKNKIKSSKLYSKIKDINNISLGICSNSLNTNMIIKCDELFNYNKMLNS
jgi:hypothetical protein